MDDIQGLILRGYGHPYIRYFILQIRDVADCADAVTGTRAFCKALLPGSGAPLTLTSAVDWGANRPPYCLNIGVTSSGLKKLIGEPNYDATNQNTDQDLFSPFDAGAAKRANLVGDKGPSDPQNWWKNGNWQLPTPPSNDDLDILIALYTNQPSDRDSFAATLLSMIPTCADGQPAARAAFIQDSDPLLDASGTPTNQIHFGYEDGLSQPRIERSPGEDLAAPDDSPWVPAWRFVIVEQTPVPGYFAAPLLVNGCFGAFRLLYQDVGAFNDFLGQAADPGLLAAKMCGRWFDGSPLEVTPDKPDPSLQGLDLTNFNYLAPTQHQKGPCESDTFGQNCPYAAHTRRANPRDDNLVNGNFNLSDPDKPLYAELHRVRRFAKPYGPPYTPDTRDAQRGLVGLFMGANLTDQFEFIMGTWFNQGGFRQIDHSPNASGLDPLLGAQGDDQYFAYCTAPPKSYQKVPDAESDGISLTRFVRTDGGLYVFLPGFTALGFMAQGELPPAPSPPSVAAG
ncbi:MAG: hypothetical protein M3347_15725 [Armatimonadota bacterium]|nr:hypothetical protein [Armatimonadota bacterium]